MYEGDIVKVSCSGEASPASLDFQWKVDGKLVEEAREARQLVLSVDRSMNGKKVSCLVRNKIAQVSDDYVLDVKCKYCTVIAGHVIYYLLIFISIFVQMARLGWRNQLT